MKLIKINPDHYVVVDDSEITQACYVYKNHKNVHGRGIFYLPLDTDFVAFNKEAKDVSVITHSTQPLGVKPITNKVVIEEDKDGKPLMSAQYVELDMSSTVKPLSLQEVKELIGEVDVEKKAREEYKDNLHNPFFTAAPMGYVKGYNQALEDNKEKKYTEEDLVKAYEYGSNALLGISKVNLTQSLQPKTEWEVELVGGKLKLI